MRKRVAILLIFLAALGVSVSSMAGDQVDDQTTPSLCSPAPAEGAAEPQPELFSIDPIPAAFCPNTCSSLQNQPCEMEGQHFFCDWGNCRRWGCTCMGGFIECGLP